MACFQEQKGASVARAGEVKIGQKERKRGVDEEAWILNPSRTSVESYIEKQADCTFKGPPGCCAEGELTGQAGVGARRAEGETVVALVLRKVAS